MDGNPCRYCSAVSRAAGEDPIGTAIAADRWMFIEIPLPWPKALLTEHPAGVAFQPLLAEIEQQPALRHLRLGAIAPDPDYSRPGHSHLLYYQRPELLFAEFAAQTYCAPTEQIADLVRALLLRPQHLDAFAAYRLPYPTRDLLVCTHTRYDVACGRFGTPIYKQLRQPLRHLIPPLRVWQTSHFGGHKFAPTLVDFPSGRFWGHLEPEILTPLIEQTGEVTQLRPFYRGWAGCDRWVQVAEREIWMQEGWPWLTYEKAGRVIARDPGKLLHRLLRWVLQWVPSPKAKAIIRRLDDECTWADVEIAFRRPDGSRAKVYQARVEVSHQVMSQGQSGVVGSRHRANQYQVVGLQQLKPDSSPIQV